MASIVVTKKFLMSLLDPTFLMPDGLYFSAGLSTAGSCYSPRQVPAPVSIFPTTHMWICWFHLQVRPCLGSQTISLYKEALIQLGIRSPTLSDRPALCLAHRRCHIPISHLELWTLPSCISHCIWVCPVHPMRAGGCPQGFPDSSLLGPPVSKQPASTHPGNRLV